MSKKVTIDKSQDLPPLEEIDKGVGSGRGAVVIEAAELDPDGKYGDLINLKSCAKCIKLNLKEVTIRC